MSLRDASKYTNMSHAHLRQLVHKDVLPCVRDPRKRIWIPKDALDVFMADRAARKAARGERKPGKAYYSYMPHGVRVLKSARSIVTKSTTIDADAQAVTIEVLDDLLGAAVADWQEKKARGETPDSE